MQDLHSSEAAETLPLWDAVGLAKNPDGSWALPEMQERCGCCHATDGEPDYCGLPLGSGPCVPCHGSGWVAKHDLEVLLAAIDEAGLLVSIRNTPSMTMARWEVELGDEPVYSDSLKQALLRAVAQALVAQGAELRGNHD